MRWRARIVSLTCFPSTQAMRKFLRSKTDCMACVYHSPFWMRQERSQLFVFFGLTLHLWTWIPGKESRGEESSASNILACLKLHTHRMPALHTAYDPYIEDQLTGRYKMNRKRCYVVC